MKKPELFFSRQLSFSSWMRMGKLFVLTFYIFFLALRTFSQNVYSEVNTEGIPAYYLSMYEDRITNVNMGIISNPGSITGNTTVLYNAVGISYSIALVPGATEYTWTVPPGATIASGQGSVSITVNFGTESGNVCVTAENACATSTESCLAINVAACMFPPQCGSQIWTYNNLNTGIVVSIGYEQTLPGEKWCYGDLPANCDTYGGLYEWSTAVNIAYTYINNWATASWGTTIENCNPCGPTTGKGGVQGICPSGYHIPSNMEWSQYEYCIENTIVPTGSTSLAVFQSTAGILASMRGTGIYGVGPGSKMLSTLWGGANTSCFNALPEGFSDSGISQYSGTYAFYWSTTECNTVRAWDREIYIGNPQSAIIDQTKLMGSSVRCLQD